MHEHAWLLLVFTVSPWQWSVAGAAFACGLVVVGLVTVAYDRRHPGEAQRELARTKIGHGLILAGVGGLALAPLQIGIQSQLRQSERRSQAVSQREARHQELVLQVSMRHDLGGADLRGSDLRGLQLANKSLRRANLRNADLRGANLSSTDFREANLEGAQLDHATATRARFDRARIAGASFRHANLAHARFTGAYDSSLDDDQYEDSTIPQGLFVSAESPSTRRPPVFDDADLAYVGFDRAHLRASFRHADLEHARLRRAWLSGSHFDGAAIQAVDATRVIVEKATFAHAFFAESNFTRADLTGAQLNDTIIVANTKFHRSDLRGADLRRLRLRVLANWHYRGVIIDASALGYQPNAAFWRSRVDRKTKGANLAVGSTRYSTGDEDCADENGTTRFLCGSALEKADRSLPNGPRVDMISSDQGAGSWSVSKPKRRRGSWWVAYPARFTDCGSGTRKKCGTILSDFVGEPDDFEASYSDDFVFLPLSMFTGHSGSLRLYARTVP